MNQLQAIPAAAQVQAPKTTAKRTETSDQDFSAALKKLVSQKEEQTAGKQGTGKQEAAREDAVKNEAARTESEKAEGAKGEALQEDTGADEEIQNKRPSMELLQQLAAGMMMQMTVQTETAATAETAEQPVIELLPTAAEQETQLPVQTESQPAANPQAGSERLSEMELPKVGVFTVVQTDENGVPVDKQAVEAGKTPVVAEELQAENKNSLAQNAETIPPESKDSTTQTQQSAVEKQQTMVEATTAKTEKSQTELPVSNQPVESSKQPAEPQGQRPAQQETPAEVEKAQPQQAERPAAVMKSEETEKPQQRTEMPAEPVGTMQQTQQSMAVKAEPKVVSEPPKTVAVQLADKFATFEATSKTEFQMQLFPEDLGEVTVKMAVRDGVMVIDILSPSSKTQQILLANADDIKNMLQSQLQQRTQVVIPTEERPADYYQQQQESRHQQQERDSQPEQNRQDNDVPLTGDFLAAFREIRLAAGLK